MDVYLPKKAFVVGEKITMRVYIRNMSNNSIETLTVKIKRVKSTMILWYIRKLLFFVLGGEGKSHTPQKR